MLFHFTTIMPTVRVASELLIGRSNVQSRRQVIGDGSGVGNGGGLHLEQHGATRSSTRCVSTQHPQHRHDRVTLHSHNHNHNHNHNHT